MLLFRSYEQQDKTLYFYLLKGIDESIFKYVLKYVYVLIPLPNLNLTLARTLSCTLKYSTYFEL